MAALSGFYEISGWPDRAPAPPYGAYTDFIVPRLAADGAPRRDRPPAPHRRGPVPRRVAVRGVAPLPGARRSSTTSSTGTVATRAGNRTDHAAPHGAYPCAGRRPLARASASAATPSGGRFCRRARPRPTWLADPRFATHAARVAQRPTRSTPRSAEATRDATTRRSSWQRLQAAGIAAGRGRRARSTCTPTRCSPAGASSSGSSTRRARRRRTTGHALRLDGRRRAGSAGRRRTSASTRRSSSASCSGCREAEIARLVEAKIAW